MQLKRPELTIYAVSFLVSAVSGLLTAIAPVRMLELGGGPVELGLLGSLAPLIYSPTAIFMGAISDRFKRKPFVAMSTSLYALACVTYCFSKDMLGMLLSRCLEGLSLASLWPPLESLLSRASSKGPQETVSLFGISWSSGSSAGALIASVFVTLITFETAMASSILVLVLCALATLFLLEEQNSPPLVEHRDSERKGTANELVAWALAFTYSFSQGVAFFIYPAFSKLLGNPPIVSLLLSSSIMLGRTLAFGVGDRLTFRVNLGLVLVIISAIALPIATFASYVLVFLMGVLLGLGVGICYMASLDFAVHSNPSDRGKYAGRFEGSLGVGYLIGPIVAGAIFPLTPLAPFVLTVSLNSGLLTLNLIKTQQQTLQKRETQGSKAPTF